MRNRNTKKYIRAVVEQFVLLMSHQSCSMRHQSCSMHHHWLLIIYQIDPIGYQETSI